MISLLRAVICWPPPEDRTAQMSQVLETKQMSPTIRTTIAQEPDLSVTSATHLPRLWPGTFQEIESPLFKNRPLKLVQAPREIFLSYNVMVKVITAEFSAGTSPMAVINAKE